ncbi:alpha/beta hydrolase [Lachnospiraceae bacterium 54-53]
MKFKEFGRKEQPTIVILHGDGLSWWSLADAVRLLEADYHVVTPIIDGHGEDASTPFISIQDSAQKVIRYIDENNSGSVFAVSGVSLGAQIVVEILSQRAGIAKYAIMESPLVVPSKRPDRFMALSCRLMRWKWYAKLKAREYFIRKNQFLQYFNDIRSMTRDSCFSIAAGSAGYTASESLKNTTANVVIIFGTKEIKKMDPSIRRLISILPKARLCILPGMRRGEFSLAHSAEYSSLIRHMAK